MGSRRFDEIGLYTLLSGFTLKTPEKWILEPINRHFVR